jgi:hypothetical protein
MELATNGGVLYWANNWNLDLGFAPDGSANVLGADLNRGTPPSTVTAIANTDGPTAMASPLGSYYVYWGNTLDRRALMRFRFYFGPTVPETVAAFPTDPGTTGLRTSALATDAQYVYWGDETIGALYKLPLDGQCIETVGMDAGGCPMLVAPDGAHVLVRLAVDNENVYFTYLDVTDGKLAIARVSKNGGPMTLLATGQGPYSAIATDGKTVYWSNFMPDSTIRSAPVDATSPCDEGTCTVVVGGQPMPNALAVDSEALYWTSQATGGYGTGYVWKLAK